MQSSNTTAKTVVAINNSKIVNPCRFLWSLYTTQHLYFTIPGKYRALTTLDAVLETLGHKTRTTNSVSDPEVVRSTLYEYKSLTLQTAG